ncbi:hypothetical protein D3867_24215 (plasmid) [Azospirillum argentinense]|uniref:Uncharacterized protein n=2 Tax=Azospirillum TaxID=191 RepID=A0A4D8Q6Y9_AZOBR|nr:hypothetical protein D3867_24215 [Azospirillum argentinense]
MLLCWRCPLPNPPPLRRGGECRRFAEGTLPCEAGEGRGGGKNPTISRTYRPTIYASYIPRPSPPPSNLYALRAQPDRAGHSRAGIRFTLTRARLSGRAPEATMLDIIALAITAAFFAASIAYVHACDRL